MEYIDGPCHSPCEGSMSFGHIRNIDPRAYVDQICTGAAGGIDWGVISFEGIEVKPEVPDWLADLQANPRL